MSTTRKSIRNYVRALLSTPAGDPLVYPIPAVAGRVYDNRSKVLHENHLPCVLVYSLSDRKERDLGQGPMRRILSLGIHVVGRESDTLDDSLDEICELAMDLIMADPRLNNYAKDTAWIGDEIGFSADGAVVAGSARMAFEVTYDWHRTPPSLDQFLTAAAGIDIEGLGPELVGGTDVLVEDIWYVVDAGTINGENIGPFKATAAHVADFTESTQIARRAEHVSTAALTGYTE